MNRKNSPKRLVSKQRAEKQFYFHNRLSQVRTRPEILRREPHLRNDATQAPTRNHYHQKPRAQYPAPLPTRPFLLHQERDTPECPARWNRSFTQTSRILQLVEFTLQASSNSRLTG